MNRRFSAVFKLRYVAVLAIIAPFLDAGLMLLLGSMLSLSADFLYKYNIFKNLQKKEDASVEASSFFVDFCFILKPYCLMIFFISIPALVFILAKYIPGDIVWPLIT